MNQNLTIVESYAEMQLASLNASPGAVFIVKNDESQGGKQYTVYTTQTVTEEIPFPTGGSATTDASQLTSGILPDERLSSNIARKTDIKVYTAGANVSISSGGVISSTVTNTTGSPATTDASQLTTGTLPDARLSTAIARVADVQKKLIAGNNITILSDGTISSNASSSGGGTGLANVVTPADFGAVGNGSTDDTAAIQAMFTSAIANKKKIFDASGKSYKITSTINVIPPAGQSEFRLDLEFCNTTGFSFTGTGACLYIAGLRFSTWQGIKMGVGSNANAVGFDLDSKAGTPNIDSTSNINFKAIHIGLGAAGQRGWRLGHVSPSGADMSVITWDNCSVYGTYGNPQTGQIGWHIEGSNTLQNVWLNCFGAFLDRLFSNRSGTGASGTGNGACYFFGMGTSHNNMEFEITNAQTYLISGGRFEVGKSMLYVENSNVSPSITFQGCEVSNYSGHPLISGNIFYMDMPGSLELDNCNFGGSYNANFLKLGGGGGGRCVGRVIIQGGCICAPKDQYYTKMSTNKWYFLVQGFGVKLLNSVEVQDVHTDKPGVVIQ